MTPNEAIDAVIKVTAEVVGVTVEEILSKSRRTDVVAARKVIVYRLRKDYDFGSTAIGQRLNRDRTSVLYLLKKGTAEKRYLQSLLRSVTERLMQIKGYGE